MKPVPMVSISSRAYLRPPKVQVAAIDEEDPKLHTGDSAINSDYSAVFRRLSRRAMRPAL
jgi:hypothetical protein